MNFNFNATAFDDGIIFTYNNCTKAIKVFRDGEKIKEEEYCSVAKVSTLRDWLIYIDMHKSVILIILEIIIVSIAKHQMVILWYIYVIALILYLIYTIYGIRKDQKDFSYQLKQYHAAEHMIYNVKRDELANITVEKLRKVSMYANNCGSNTNVEKVLNFIFIGISSNIFGYSIIDEENFIFIALNMMIFAVSISIIENLSSFLMELGYFNHIVQPLFLEEPTDEQLELAIYGMKRVEELETEKSN